MNAVLSVSSPQKISITESKCIGDERQERHFIRKGDEISVGSQLFSVDGISLGGDVCVCVFFPFGNNIEFGYILAQ